MSRQEIDRPANLTDDSAHTRLGRYRIFDKRHVEAVRERTGSNMGEVLLGQALPIASVNECNGRCSSVRAGDPVYSLARGLTIRQVSLDADALVDRSAATTEIGHHFRH